MPIARNIDDAITNLGRDDFERVSLARSRETKPVVDAKYRAMGRAHDVCPLGIEKAVGRPVER